MRPASVLLVEPDDDSRTLYADYLRLNGLAVLIAETTDAGLTMAEDADIIVTGIRMSGSFDGVELVRRLRAAEATKAIPILVLTACAFEPDQERSMAAGCDVFLPKPCLPDTLAAEIRRLLALKQLPKPRPTRAEHAKRSKRNAS